MAKNTKDKDNLIKTTTNVCFCISGLAMALISVNALYPQNSLNFANPSVVSASAPVQTDHKLAPATKPGTMATNSPEASPLRKGRRVASLGDQSIAVASRTDEAPLAPILPWGAHLTASWSEAKALTQFSNIRSRFPGVLSDKQPMVVRLNNHGMGSAARYAVRIGQPDREKAEKFCSRLIQAGGACVVYKTARR